MKKMIKQFFNTLYNHKIITFVAIVFLGIAFLTIVPTFSEKTTSSVWDGSVSENFTSGNGTISDPYIISTGSEFAYFINLINGDDNLSYFNKYYELDNNIDFNEYSLPLATFDKVFSGNINGNGYTLSNFTISLGYSSSSSDLYYGLFDSLNNAHIGYLNMDDITINISEVTDINFNSNIYVSLFGRDASNNNFSNISINNLRIIDNSNYDSVITSSFIINDGGNNTFNNINLDIISNNENAVQLIYDYDDSTFNNIIYKNINLDVVKDYEDSSSLYHYVVTDGEIMSDNLEDNTSLIDMINSESNLEWYVNNGKLKIRNMGTYNSLKAPMMLSMLSSNSYFGTITPHNSGIESNVLYINDFEADYNYYKSLNYTEIIDGRVLPGEENTGYYDDEYLVQVEIIYDGADFTNSSLVGKVSPTESVNKYIYYKYYPLKRSSSGSLLTDDDGNNYIEIELIDNPFSARPTGRGFVGWATANEDVILSYDKDTYTRYARVPITGNGSIVLTFNAIWGKANIQTGGTAAIDDLDDASMKLMETTESITTTEIRHYDCNPYFNQDVTTIPDTASGNVKNGSIPAGVYYTTTANAGTGANFSYSGTGARCGNTRCYYYYPTTITSGTSYNSSNTYKIIYLNSGTNYRYTTDVTDYVSYNSCSEEYQVTRQVQVSYFSENDLSVGYFYSVGTNYNAASGLYYDNTGLNCNMSGNTCSSGAYKLIQYNDSINKSNGESISIIEVDSDNNVINSNKYYYLVTRDMNILVNTSNGTNISNYMSTKPYTLTSSYNGAAISNNVVVANTATVNSDMVIENIKIRGVGGSTVSETASATTSINANCHNFKIGRNVTYVSNTGNASDVNKIFNGVFGIGSNYNGTSTNPDRFKIIVESGNYNYLLSGTADGYGNNRDNFYLNASFVYGSDYDRVRGDDSKLKVYFNALSTIKDNFISTTANKAVPSSTIIIKSGRYGKDANNNYSTSNTNGIYAGGRTTTHYANALRVLKVEGGDINIINGGPCVEDNLTTDSVAIYMTGGIVRQIYGGAGTTTTYGNRLISVSGGNVLYSVFGGSNAYDSGSEGLLTGSTLLYIGGNAVIGDDDIIDAGTLLFNVSSGHVFGAGNGDDGGTTAGIVSNSHIIVNGGEIKGSVYGGGNHGSVGTLNSANVSSEVVIDLLGGTIGDSVFGAGESFGGGYSGASTSQSSSLKKDYYTGVNTAVSSSTDVTVTVRDHNNNIISGPTTTHQNTNGTIPNGSYLPDESRVNANTTCTSSVVGATISDPITETRTENVNCVNVYNQNVITVPNSNATLRVANGNALPVGVYYTRNNSGTVGTTTTMYLSNGENCSVTGIGFGTRYCYYYNPTTYTSGSNVVNNVRYIYSYNGNYRYTTSTNNYVTQRCDVRTTTTVTTNTNCQYATSIAASGSTYNSSTNYYEARDNSFVRVTPQVNLIKTNNYTHSVAINLDGSSITNAIYGGSNKAGTLYGNVDINLYSGVSNAVYGGGKGISGEEGAVAVLGNTYITSSTLVDNELNVTSVYGGSALGSVNEYGKTVIEIDGGTFSDVYGGGMGDNNTEPKNNGNINVTINDGQITNVYGGNNISGIPLGEVNVELKGGTVANAFGGGSLSSVTVSNIHMNGITSCGSIYGGSNVSGNVTNSNVFLENGHCDYVYGGNNLGGTTNVSNVIVSGGEIIDIYGGGKNATTGTSNVTCNGGEATNIFGGGEEAAVNVSSTVTYNGGNITNIYGGSNTSGNVPVTNIYANAGETSYIYGGGKLAPIGESNIHMDGTDSTYVFGGGESASVTGGTNVVITDGNITKVFGGSNTAGSVNNSEITANGGIIDTIYGGNNAGGVTSESLINENGSKVNTIYGGGDAANTDVSNVNINSCTEGITDIYGGGKSASVTTTNVRILGCNIQNVYGGSNTSGTVTNANVTIGTSSSSLSDITIQNVYGGNNAGGVTVNPKVIVNEGIVTNAFGGGNNAVVSGSTDIKINDGNLTNVYGGGNNAGVRNDSNLTILGGIVSNNIYGGGNEGIIEKNTHVLLEDATINGSAYAGGNGTTATVYGNTNIYAGGDTVIGTASCEILSRCSLFGGGNAAYTGDVSTNNSNAVVNVAGATIYGNVYGGANTSRVYGQTKVDVGNSVVLVNNLTRDDVDIRGSIFGGGEANASGSSVYDFSYISVTVAIDVNIDAAGYDNFNIDGSIFGSGNASSTSGVSNITISNYGTLNNPEKNISIQRTNLLVLDNSSIVLYGATDRTNEYSSVLFSLSRIDELNLTNNSTLYLENNANLLKSFKSKVSPNSNTLAQVTITDNGMTRNVNNRLYMFEGQILNISTSENVNAAGAYGTVDGMTFFGMYHYTSDDNVYTGIYGDYGFNSPLSYSGIINNSSYVLGQHEENHNIEVDGFYTNNIDDNTGLNAMAYIQPTPNDSPFYMWLIGAQITNITIDLEASKYSTLGAKEESFINFTDPNTSFSIVEFDYTELAPGISIVPKSSIPRVASTTDIADSVMSLTIESGTTGWLNNGTTGFLSSEPSITGTTTYVGDNTTDPPSLIFYLNHSKNLGSSGDMGKVKIVMTAVTRIDDLTNDTKILIVTINLSRQLITTDDYEGTITSGRKYELFASTVTNVTSKSSISAYYSLFAERNLYRAGYHRALISNSVLPLGTKITMIDLSLENPNYYYHVINQSDVISATQQLSTQGDIRYELSMFEVMGAIGSGEYYDDNAMNSAYYNSTLNYSSEEFIFILDFEDTSLSGNSLNNSLLIEMLNSQEDTIMGVLGIQHGSLIYNLYSVDDAMIDLTGAISSNKIYSGDSAVIDLDTEYTQAVVSGVTITDTLYSNYKLGLKINLLNSNGDIVSGTSLVGLYYEINGNRYSPNIDGTTRIKIAEKVGNVKTWIKMATGNSNIATGSYTIRIEEFGSSDGIYNGLSNSAVLEIPIYIVNEIYGLDINTSYEEMIIDSDTGYNLKNTNIVKYLIEYNSGLTNPSIHIRLYRRKYDEIYSADYELVDLADYVSNTLFATSVENDYLVVNNPNENTVLNLTMKDNLLNGTYKVEFVLYDDTSEIGIIEKYFVIK